MESCGLIILASGASQRLGQPKQLLLYNDKLLIRCIAQTALQVTPSHVIITLGSNASPIQKAIEDLPVKVVYNGDWKEGISSSIRVGLTTLLTINPWIDNVILMVCDQPYVTAEILKSLISKHTESNKGIVASAYSNTLGTPVLFNKKYFSELLDLKGAEGAKKLIKKHPEDVTEIHFPLGRIDIDTIEDYHFLLKNNFTT